MSTLMVEECSRVWEAALCPTLKYHRFHPFNHRCKHFPLKTLWFETLNIYLPSHRETLWIRAMANCLKCKWAQNCKQPFPELMLVEDLLIEQLLFHPRISKSISGGLVLLALGNSRGRADYIQGHILISTADAKINTSNVCLSSIRWKNYISGEVFPLDSDPHLSVHRFVSGHHCSGSFRPGVIREGKKQINHASN